MEKLVSVWYSDAAWVTSIAEDESTHSLAVWRNLSPYVLVCENEFQGALTMPASWDIL